MAHTHHRIEQAGHIASFTTHNNITAAVAAAAAHEHRHGSGTGCKISVGPAPRLALSSPKCNLRPAITDALELDDDRRGFLTSQWHVWSAGGFAESCLRAMALTVALEALRRGVREYDAYIARDFTRRGAVLVAASAKGEAPGGGNHKQAQQAQQQQQRVTLRATAMKQLIRTVLHAVAFAVAYMVMLLAMYFNWYMILCIFVGAGLGKFLCDWMSRTVVLSGEGGAVVLGGNGAD